MAINNRLAAKREMRMGIDKYFNANKIAIENCFRDVYRVYALADFHSFSANNYQSQQQL